MSTYILTHTNLICVFTKIRYVFIHNYIYSIEYNTETTLQFCIYIVIYVKMHIA